MRLSRFVVSTFALAALVLALAFGCQAQTVATLYNFGATSASEGPAYVTPVQARNGEIYGTTAGPQGIDGSIFALSVSGRLAEPYIFSDAASPAGGLTLGSDGYLYGTSYTGGGFGSGYLFKISPASVFTDLHDFQDGSDGATPYSPPIQASDGNFYGTTIGAGGASTIYKYETGGTFTTILSLSTSQGAELADPLIQGSDGNLYGTAFVGGATGCGTVFKVSTGGEMLWNYSFPCGSGGASPFGPLVQGADGNYYGTTESGGAYDNYGTVFKLDSTSGNVSILHRFDYFDGNNIFSGLTQGTDGNLYGVAASGGKAGFGTLFSISLGGVFKLLYNFGVSGKTPYSAPLQDTNGIFYGTTYAGGHYGYGTAYSLNMELGPFVAFVQPDAKVGQTAEILGQGLTGTSAVVFDGVAATEFSVVNDTYMTAVVPSGATTGPVVVTTPGGALTSNVSFRIIN